MVYPIPDLKQSPENSSKKANRKRKRKSSYRKVKKVSIAKKKDKLASTMSTWAEQFTAAATWQMKHQLAYWKAKAISLEYENKILHDIIRQNSSVPEEPSSSSKSDFQSRAVPKTYHSQLDTGNSETESEQDAMPEEEENWEVSAEFIDFLTKNAKFKEEARRERERLKSERAEKNDVKILEAGPSEPPKNKSVEMKELYGTVWQKIAAFEISLQSNFIHECDKNKPMYWPNIPLNFS